MAKPSRSGAAFDKPFGLEDIPSGELFQQLTRLNPIALERALTKLSDPRIPHADFNSLRVVSDGSLFYACDLPHDHSNHHHSSAAAQLADESAITPDKEISAAASATPPVRHSRPGSSNIIYLDFTGPTISGTLWNTDYNGGAAFTTLPYSTDGDYSSFSEIEQAVIIRTWERVAEDYRPFDVDVTTEAPAAMGANVVHVVITRSTRGDGATNPEAANAGGIAFLNNFGADYAPPYSPAFVYHNHTAEESGMAVAVSHEAGHYIGNLHHDGFNSTEYYQGHGSGDTSWGPIMGAPYGKNITQWSNGSYPGGNNVTEDDLSLLANRLGYTSDDHSDNNSTASAITFTGTVFSANGIIGTTGDTDRFAITLPTGDVEISVAPFRSTTAPNGGNLDILLELLNQNGDILASDNPLEETSASISTSVPAGTYYIRISPVGYPVSGFSTGYAVYGSLGAYQLSGSIGTDSPPIVAEQTTGLQIVGPGGNTSLSVTGVSNNGSITYQWMHDGLPISGANTSVLHLTGLDYSQSGAYWMTLTNDSGVTRSAPIFVRVAPNITQVRGWGYADAVDEIPSDLSNAVTIDAGVSLAVTTNIDGTVSAWADLTSFLPSGLEGIVDAKGGYQQVIALKDDGTVIGWGFPGYGESSPPAGLNNVIAIDAGIEHSVALKSDGTVVAWGRNGYGETTVPANLAPVVAIAAGKYYTLALQADGTVAAWGKNDLGQTAVPAGLSSVIAIAAGQEHALALKADGTVVGWGNNTYGQTTIPSGLADVVQITAGRDHSLAIKSDGTVVGWGHNGFNESLPPSGLEDVFAISAGQVFTLAIRDASADTAPVIDVPPSNLTVAEGQSATMSVVASAAGPLAYQWRKNAVAIAGATSSTFTLDQALPSDAGEYDVIVTNHIGATTSSTATLTVNPLPVVSGLHTATRVVVEPSQPLNLGVNATGTGSLSYQWFLNGRPITGATSASYNTSSPTHLDSGWYVVDITDDYGTRRSPAMFVNVIPAKTEVRIWGLGSNSDMAIPSSASDIGALSLSSSHALAIRRDGSVLAWGEDYAGSTEVPEGLSDVVAVSASSRGSLALKADGTVISFTYQFVPPEGVADVVAIALSSDRAYALKRDGTVISWRDRYTLDDTGLTDIVAISAFSNTMLALMSDGTVVKWDGPSELNVPSGLNDITAIATASRHALALNSNGTITVWGEDSYDHGILDIPSGLNSIVAISAGSSHSLALKADGTVVAWGNNNGDRSTPPEDLDNCFAIEARSVFSAALRDATNDSPPLITIPPASLIASETSRATFTVTADGTGILFYQWRKDGENIPNETNSTIILSNISPTDAGSYDVVVTNHFGSSTSAAALLTINRIPIVTYQSPKHQIATSGETITINATATGSGLISYQWMHNNRPISGATSSSLTLANSSYENSGAYFLLATDSYGTRYGAPMFVTIAPEETEIIGWGKPGSITPPAGLDNAIDISTGGSISFALKPDGTIVSWGQQLSGGGGAPSGLTNVVSVAAAYHGGIALKSDGTVTTWNSFWDEEDIPPFDLKNVIQIAAGGGHYIALKNDGTVIAWGDNSHGETLVPADLHDIVKIAAGRDLSMAIKADGTLVMWGNHTNNRNLLPSGLSGVKEAGGNYINAYAVVSDGTVVGWGNYEEGLSDIPEGLNNVTSLASGEYHMLALTQNRTIFTWGSNNYGETSPPEALTGVYKIAAAGRHSLALRDTSPVTIPVISTLLSSKTISLGNSGNFSVTATGTPVISYQWQHLPSGTSIWHDLNDGDAYSGVNTPALTISNTILAMDGDQFRVIAANSQGTAISNAATLTVTIPEPTIINQPSDQLAASGTSVILNVTAESPVSMTYQWKKNGTDIIDATSSTYNIPSVQSGDEGDYTVVVTNSAGSITSEGATITIALPPMIIAGPPTTTIYAGDSTILGVLVTSNAPVTYQWNKDGTPISGEKSTTYAISNAQASDAGNYTVTVTNLAGAVTSATATVTVTPSTAPTITGHPTDRTVGVSGAINFTASAAGIPAPTYQWQRRLAGTDLWSNIGEGAPLLTFEGTDQPTLSLYSGATQLTNHGDQYRVVATNAAGQTISNPAVLTVTAHAAPIQISGGSNHSIFLRLNGEVWGMGRNQEGQFGYGNSGQQNSPVTSVSDIVSLTAGSDHSLLIKSDGTLLGTGFNEYGALGTGTVANAASPVTITSGVAEAIGTHRSSFFRKTDGTLWAMGWNVYGQLGDGTTTNRLSPVHISDHVTGMAAGYFQSLFVKSDGTLWAMGDNTYGQFGNGTTTGSLTPVQVNTGVKQVSSGHYHTLILKQDQSLWATGLNNQGQLGDGTNITVYTPVQVTTDVQAIETGALHSVFLKTDGTLWTMGHNAYGQLGDGTTTNRSTPMQIDTQVTSITAGHYFTQYTKTDGTLWAMGANEQGQLGDGSTFTRLTPVPIASGGGGLPQTAAQPTATVSDSADRITLTWNHVIGASHYEIWRSETDDRSTATRIADRITGNFHEDLTATQGVTYFYWIDAINPYGSRQGSSAQGRHGIALPMGYALWAVGDNFYGQLGDGTDISRLTPVAIAENVVSASGGDQHTLFIKSDGTLWGMGWNNVGYFGNGTQTQSLTPLLLASGVKSASAGFGHSLFIKNDNTLWGMGENDAAQIDSEGTGYRLNPVQIAQDVRTAVAGIENTFYIKNDGTLWARGNNNYGQLGDGTTTMRNTAFQIASNVLQVASGFGHALFLKTDGTLWTCGENSSGQLGTGDNLARLSPVQIASGVQSIAAGENHTLYIKNDGTLWGCGSNAWGQIDGATGSPTNRFTPVQIASNVISVAANRQSTLYLKSGGEVWARGGNFKGELGDGSTNHRTSAVLITRNAHSLKTGSFHTLFMSTDGLTSVPLPPAIVSQPESETVLLGSSATFTVDATGEGPLSYQWYLGDNPVNGATSSTLIINAASGPSSNYYVVVTNAAGSLRSENVYILMTALDQSINFSTLADRSFTLDPITLSATADSGLSVSFNVVSGPATLSGNELSLTGTGTVTVRASQAGNANYTAAPHVDRSFEVTASAQSWLLGHFTEAELDDEAISGPTADPDGDGMTNLLEYALGLDPRSTDTTGLPEMSTTATDWVYTYTRPVDRDDITYQVEISTDLSSWSSSGVTHELISTDGSTQTWKASVPLSSATSLYFHLKITQN